MKSLVESKIFWVNVVNIIGLVAGVVPAPYNTYVASFVSVLTILLRSTSNTEITSILPK